MILPTADDVARAIVAACRETGDDPIGTAEGRLGTGEGCPTNRARHYAMHALLHVFPDLPRLTAARLVGCPGSPAQFWNSSWHQIAKPRGSGLGHVANWFDDDAYGRVIAAIEGGMSVFASSNEDEKSDNVGKVLAVASLTRQAKISAFGRTLSQAPAPPRNFSTAEEDGLARRASERRSLQDILAEAARNTAKLAPPKEGDQ